MYCQICGNVLDENNRFDNKAYNCVAEYLGVDAIDNMIVLIYNYYGICKRCVLEELAKRHADDLNWEIVEEELKNN